MLSFLAIKLLGRAMLAPRPIAGNCRPVASVMITGEGSFSSDFGPFQGFKIGDFSVCLGETSIFKILLIDNVTLCPKLESTMVSLLDFINSIS